MNTKNYKKIISLAPVLLLCAILLPQMTFAADRYWVGGTGSWSSTAQWAETSGGGSGASVPSAADNCIFDSASNATAYTVTVDTDATCLDLTFAAPASGTISLAGSATTTISGNLTMLSGMTNSYTGNITFNSTATGKTITTNTVSLENSSVTFNGSGGAWTFTDTATTSSFTITQGTVTAPTSLIIGGSYSNSGTFTAGSGTVKFTSPLFQYIAGVDATGTVGSGTGQSQFNGVYVSGNYAYAVTQSNSTACSSSVGSAIGCELQIYDISNPAEPAYIGGADASGSTNSGTGQTTFYGVYVSGNYAYVASAGSATVCSSSAGSGIGCEVQIYDISDPAAPAYVAGIDASGSVGSGTASSPIYDIFVSGNYAYVTSFANATACSSDAGSGIGCELKIFDISNPAAPSYVAGVDATGTVGSGIGSITFNKVFVSGNYAYIASLGTVTACSSAAGSATGCELQIYDVTTPASPSYVTGIDASGSVAAGTSNVSFTSVYVSGNYLYTGSAGLSTACVSTAGSAHGCELKIFDITNPAAPTFAVGVDASGSVGSGTSAANFSSISMIGDYVLIGTGFSGAVCSSVVGSATGCELKVFNISNPASPTYIMGMDSTGVAGSGAGTISFNGVFVAGNYVYVAANPHFNACSDIAGSDVGCEFKVIQYRAPTPATLSGTLDSLSAFTDMNFAAGSAYQINNNVSVVDFKAYGAYLRIPVEVTVNRDYIGSSAVDFTGGTLNITNSAAERTVPLPVAIAGVDSTGNLNAGSYGTTINNVAIFGNYLYAMSSASNIPCTNVAGGGFGALGCEVKIFEMTDPAAPAYIAGMDASGSTNSGTGLISVADVFVSGNYAYVARGGNTTACSSVAGSAIGCELQIYDVSDPAAPVLVAGVDSSGSVGSGTSDRSITSVFVSGNYAYVTNLGTSVACSSVVGSATGCEFQIYDVSNPAAPSLVAGMDASGTVGSGAGSITFNDVVVSGNYAYIGSSSFASCSTVGFATGCEFRIIDVSDPAAPVYRAGIDASGSRNSGTQGVTFNRVAISGNYAYVTSAASATTCSSVVGSALGCELKIFDISSSTAPTYVVGIDSSGSIGSGVGAVTLAGVAVSESYLYVSNSSGSITACSDIAGNAVGCELQIYDIASSTAPTYVAGADASGKPGVGANGNGIDTSATWSVIVSGDYAYVSKAASTIDCGGIGNKIGCEILVFDLKPATTISGGSLGSVSITGATTTTLVSSAELSGTFENSSTFLAQSAVSLSIAGDFSNSGTIYAPPTLTVSGGYANTGSAVMGSAVATAFNGVSAQSLSGNMTGTNTFGPVTFSGAGAKTFINNASTTSFTIQSGSTVSAPPLLSIDGAYLNDGTFNAVGGNIYLNGSYQNNGTLNAQAGNIYFTANFGGSLVGSIDGGGSASGAIFSTLSDIFLLGDYAYVVGLGNATACSSSAGSGIGCELKIFDISSSTAPTYAAGIDATGAAGSGTGNSAFNRITVSGNYAYITSNGNATECTNTVGSAIGCELKIFDISSSTAPTYVAGIDVSSTVGAGTGNLVTNGVLISDNYLYVASGANATECTNTVGSAIGCELKIFDISSSTAPVYVTGVDATGTVGSGAGFSSFFGLFKYGNYLYVAAGINATECSNTVGSAIGCDLKIFDISSSTAPAYVAGIDGSGSVGSGTSDVANLNSVAFLGNYMYVVSTGSSVECTSDVATAIGCEIKIYDITNPAAPVYVTGVDGGGTVESGSVSITANSIFVSDNYAYVVTSANANECSNTIGFAEGCEVKIFDISSSTAPVYITGIDATGTTGSGAGSVAHNRAWVSGEHLYAASSGNSTACTNTAGSAIGCELKSYLIPSTIAGSLAGENALYGVNIEEGDYAFSAQASTTNLSIAQGAKMTAPTLLDIAGNYANEGAFTAGTGTVYLSGNTTQTLSGTLDGTNALYNLTVSNTTSSILFTATTSVTNIFTMLPSTSAQFLAGATSTFQQIDWQGTSGDPISLSSTEPDSSWSIAVPGSRTLSYVRVKDSNACSGESDLNGGTGSVNLGNNFCWTLEITPVFLNAGTSIGGNAPAGQDTVVGGSGSGGVDIGGLPGFFAPTNSGSASGFSTGWTSLTNAYLSDNSRASATTQAASDFYGFGFNIPSGDQVTGIAVRLEGSSDTGAGTISAELSWNAGVSTTTSNIVTTTLGNTDDVYALGSDATLWGRSWVPTEFSDANFRLRLIGVPSNNSIFLDAIQVKIIHHASGGSGSGGGEI